jgi:hypothetical protein
VPRALGFSDETRPGLRAPKIDSQGNVLARRLSHIPLISDKDAIIAVFKDFGA